MSTILNFVNHACFHVRNDNALLLIDPWLEGTAFNNGWSLLDQSTSNAGLVAQLNRLGLPTYIWYSHEHPDHFSISFIKKFKEEFRGKATFLFQRTHDQRVVDFLRRNAFDVIECGTAKPVALGRDLAITVFPYSDGDSYCLIQAGGRTIVNLNDCAVTTGAQCRAVKTQLEVIAPKIDLMLTQFGYANWVGNPDQPALHKAAAAEKIERIALQMDILKPTIVVPFASFVYFSQPDNAYLNDGQNSPRSILDSPRLAQAAAAIRFLQPGGTIDLGRDTPAMLASSSSRAVAHWMGLMKADLALLPSQPAVPMAELQAAFLQYRKTISNRLHGLPQLLELTGRVNPLLIHLSDLQVTVQASYRSGLTVLARNASFDISMTSANAIFLFKNEYGFDTTQVNGRFRTAQAGAMSTFRRFFLPQRMGKNGYDRRHPFLMAAYLARQLRSGVMRQWQAAQRKLKYSA